MNNYKKAEMSIIIVLFTAFIIYLIVDKMKKLKLKTNNKIEFFIIF